MLTSLRDEQPPRLLLIYDSYIWARPHPLDHGIDWIHFFAQRLRTGIRYWERASTKGLVVKVIINLDYGAVAGCPAPPCSAFGLFGELCEAVDAVDPRG